MSIVQEITTFSDVDGVSIEVNEKTKGEVFKKGEIISINVDTMRWYTPKELISLGEWFIQHGKRIKCEYTNTGHKIRR